MSSSSSFSDIETISEMKALRKVIAQLQIANEQLIMEKMAREAPNEEESILTSIVGSWKIVSSVGMQEFLERLNPSPLMSAYYQVANHHFENHNGVLTTSVSVGISEVHRETLTIGERTENRLCFIENNSLIWVFFKPDGEEYARAEHFVKDGKYHTVTQRFGMKCTRVYEKVGTEKDLRIAELEAELEMLKVEKNGEVEKLKEELEVLKVERSKEKEQFIALLEEKNADIEELTDELEILEEEKIENEKKVEAEKEEREKFVERLREEIDTLIDEKTKNMDERRKKEKKKLEKMKKKLEEKALKDDSAESEEEISFEWFFNRHTGKKTTAVYDRVV